MTVMTLKIVKIKSIPIKKITADFNRDNYALYEFFKNAFILAWRKTDE